MERVRQLVVEKEVVIDLRARSAIIPLLTVLRYVAEKWQRCFLRMLTWVKKTLTSALKERQGPILPHLLTMR